ncbi:MULTISPECIES: hypothetical protein [Paenarthrobacter]|uniref:hypothetical protein n=1 Tax=Paenarthrobacter TaxID=1742992 RepID=UPI00074D2CD4|nr:hypothetical protein [Paenarthrobacter ureafaciens]AMB40350.1 hypothetical protein AUT26_09110 [Arthrobacter sp. ATCC 21022]KUR63551.1 hypothetical protein JM67_17730 [Arthrobacter sp. ATCC 21022]RWW91511.1 hypothetical protein AUR_19240 [Paenarthrobacter ureafaciens]
MNPAAPELYSIQDGNETAAHTNVWRIREDLWEYLTYTVEKMGHELSADAGEHLASDIVRVLDQLQTVEGYWAHPGMAPSMDCGYSPMNGTMPGWVKHSPPSNDDGDAKTQRRHQLPHRLNTRPPLGARILRCCL